MLSIKKSLRLALALGLTGLVAVLPAVTLAAPKATMECPCAKTCKDSNCKNCKCEGTECQKGACAGQNADKEKAVKE